MPVSLWQSLRIPANQTGGSGDRGRRVYESDDASCCSSNRGGTRDSEPNAKSRDGQQSGGPFASASFSHSSLRLTRFNRSKVRVVGTRFVRRSWMACSRAGRSRDPASADFRGSQGAKAMNAAVMEGLPDLMTQLPHLTVTIRPASPTIHGWSRPIVAPALSQKSCRLSMTCLRHYGRRIWSWREPGAMTVAELTACGKPAILIPLPSAIYDHQTRNAKVMEAAGAAVVLPAILGSQTPVWSARWRPFSGIRSD